MKILAIIPARGGSKRIPKKNIRQFLDRPIISYSVEAAICSNCFSEVMVSTDNNEIASIAINSGASVPFLRSPETSDDFATTADVIEEVIKKYQATGRIFEYVCCLYPTAPFITPVKINEMFKLLVKHKADSVMTVVRFSYPVQRALLLENGLIKMAFPEFINTRSQDLPAMYHDAGQIYWLNSSVFLKEKIMMMEKTIPYEVSELEVQDIDSETDWEIAEIKYSLMIKKGAAK